MHEVRCQNSNGIDSIVSRSSFGLSFAMSPLPGRIRQHYGAQQSGTPERRATLRLARRARGTCCNRRFCVRIDIVGSFDDGRATAEAGGEAENFS